MDFRGLVDVLCECTERDGDCQIWTGPTDDSGVPMIPRCLPVPEGGNARELWLASYNKPLKPGEVALPACGRRLCLAHTEAAPKGSSIENYWADELWGAIEAWHRLQKRRSKSKKKLEAARIAVEDAVRRTIATEIGAVLEKWRPKLGRKGYSAPRIGDRAK